MDQTSTNSINLISLMLAAIAVLISFGSLVVSFLAFRLSQRQDDRRRPSLVPSFLNGYVQFCDEDKVRLYAFLLSISNPSDSNNALARAELHVTYKTLSGQPVTVQIPSSQVVGNGFSELEDFRLVVMPARLDAHQTITGWILFRISESILSESEINCYSILLVDSHQIRTSVEPIMIQEYISGIVPSVRKNSAPR